MPGRGARRTGRGARPRGHRRRQRQHRRNRRGPGRLRRADRRRAPGPQHRVCGGRQHRLRPVDGRARPPAQPRRHRPRGRDRGAGEPPRRAPARRRGRRRCCTRPTARCSRSRAASSTSRASRCASRRRASCWTHAVRTARCAIAATRTAGTGRWLDPPLPVDCPAAACVLFRRELLEPRPLDPDFPLFFNDADLARRIRHAGFTLDVVPAARAGHAGATSVKRADVMGVRAEWVASLRRYPAPECGSGPGAGRCGRSSWPTPSFMAIQHAVRRGRPETPSLVRGTLGGLGLPGGRPPLFSRPRRG